MISTSVVRVRYAETDQMGVVYHSNFLLYFEIGRTDYFRKLGFTYKQLEQEDVFMPVTECFCRFLSSAFYDDELEILTRLQMLSRLRFQFDYEVYRKSDSKKIAQGYTIHVPTRSGGNPCRVPSEYLDALKKAVEG